MKKKFDCVEMKREGARQIYEKIGKMTLDQQLVFWRERTTSLQMHKKQIRQRATDRA